MRRKGIFADRPIQEEKIARHANHTAPRVHLVAHRHGHVTQAPHRLIALLISTLSTAALANGLPPWLSAELSARNIPPEAVAVYVRDPASRTVVFAHNATTLFKPASIMKVLTTFAALEVLGEEYQWQTPVFCSGDISKGELKGDLVIRGVGDPSLSHEKLQQLAAILLKRGVRMIRGDVILDNSFFPFDTNVPSQFHREIENPWNLPPHPLLVNGKTVTLTVDSQGESTKTRVRFEPPLRTVHISNSINLVRSGECLNPKQTIDIAVDGSADSATLKMSGSFTAGCSPFIRKISLLGAESYFAESFRAIFEGMGGKITGRFRTGEQKEEVRLISAMRSEPLMDILRETNKNSNNLMARLLFLTIGAELTGRPPSPQLAATAIHQWISKRVKETQSFKLENGSGLSDAERVTAEGMVALLDHIQASKHAAQFLDTLPAVGRDGTMRNRLSGHRVAGRSVAKTGTLRDTRAIAGSMVNSHGRALVYTMIINHPRAGDGLAIINKLIDRLDDLPPEKHK